MLNRLKKVPDVAYTIMSLAATAAVNYTIIHSPLVPVFIAVLLAHELGHYFAAKLHGAKPRTPIFLPIPFIMVAITKISKLTNRQKKDTAFYGPFTGFMTALFFIVANFIFNFTSYIPLIALATGEVVFNYFGSDGKKYREAKRNLLCT
jgi:hypothetical protein